MNASWLRTCCCFFVSPPCVCQLWYSELKGRGKRRKLKTCKSLYEKSHVWFTSQSVSMLSVSRQPIAELLYKNKMNHKASVKFELEEKLIKDWSDANSQLHIASCAFTALTVTCQKVESCSQSELECLSWRWTCKGMDTCLLEIILYNKLLTHWHCQAQKWHFSETNTKDEGDSQCTMWSIHSCTPSTETFSITQLDPMLTLKANLSIITLITKQNRLLGTVRYVREQFGT